MTQENSNNQLTFSTGILSAIPVVLIYLLASDLLEIFRIAVGSNTLLISEPTGTLVLMGICSLPVLLLSLFEAQLQIGKKLRNNPTNRVVHGIGCIAGAFLTVALIITTLAFIDIAQWPAPIEEIDSDLDSRLRSFGLISFLLFIYSILIRRFMRSTK